MRKLEPMEPQKKEAEQYSFRDFMAQSTWWTSKDGLKRVDSMSVVHRRRAAMSLLRKAPLLALYDLLQEELDRPEVTTPALEVFARLGASRTWLKTKAIYQALIVDGADPDEPWTEEVIS